MLFRVTVGRASFDNEVDEQFRFCGQRAGSRICDLSSSGPTSFRREQPAKDTATSASKTSEMNRWFRNIRVQVYQLLLLPERVIDRVSAGSKSARRELVDGLAWPRFRVESDLAGGCSHLAEKSVTDVPFTAEP
jgi:hypothetical protein